MGNCIVDCFIVNYLSIDYSQLKRGKDVSRFYEKQKLNRSDEVFLFAIFVTIMVNYFWKAI